MLCFVRFLVTAPQPSKAWSQGPSLVIVITKVRVCKHKISSLTSQNVPTFNSSSLTIKDWYLKLPLLWISLPAFMMDFSEKFLILCKNSLSRCCMIQAKPVQVHDTWSSETDVTTRNHHHLNPNKYPVPSQISPRGLSIRPAQDNVLLLCWQGVC